MYELNAIQHHLIVKLLGEGGYQHQIGQHHLLGLSQSMLRCFKEVCVVIEYIFHPKHIEFGLTAEEENDIKR